MQLLEGFVTLHELYNMCVSKGGNAIFFLKQQVFDWQCSHASSSVRQNPILYLRCPGDLGVKYDR